MAQHYKIGDQIYEVPDDATIGDVQNHLSSADNISAPQTFSEKYQDFWNSQKPNPNDPKDRDVTETMFGRMHKNIPELTPGTEENKDQLENMINMAAGAPGLKLLGGAAMKAPGIIKNTLKDAFKNVEPYQTSAQNAAQEAEQATTHAAIPKPGLYQNPQTELENVEGQIGKYINAEADHGTRAGRSITSRVKDIQKYWSDSYKQFEDKIKDVKFKMPENVLQSLNIDPEKVLAKLRAGIDPNKIVLEEKNPFYEHLISKAPTSEDSSAKDFLAKYRDFRDTMGGLKEDLKSERYGSIEKEKISDAIKKGSEMENQIKDTLTTGLGEHKPEFDWLMKGYSEQVFPLRRNPLVKAAKEGKMPANIINSLRTNQSGMDVLRGIVKQDPELTKNVIGQRYMASPGEVHAPNELMREYLDEVPEFKGLLNKREDILQKAVNRKDISLKNKIETQKKLKEIEAAKAKAKDKLWMGGIGAGSAIGVPYGYGKISKMFGD